MAINELSQHDAYVNEQLAQPGTAFIHCLEESTVIAKRESAQSWRDFWMTRGQTPPPGAYEQFKRNL